MNSSIKEYEQALGRWPRRLLRIADLTSFEWQPGNVYGGVKEPSYNAISYTWGRWKLKDGVKPEIHPLPIKGIPWIQHLPRIDPSHFTIQEFLALIQNAGSTPTEENYPPVEFIWLDIACIDQRNTEQISAAEIGRQGLIFRGAQAVFIWFTTMYSSENYQVFGKIDWWFSPPSEHTGESIKPIVDNIVTFLDVLKDPWFSSLWTLQEAYLRPDAVIFTRLGQRVIYDLYEGKDILTLRHLLVWGVNSDGFCTQRAAINHGKGIFAAFKKVIAERGLIALRARNTMALLGAAMYRTTSVSADRVYGIQQVFDLRLGKTSLDGVYGASPSLSELEDELGEALLTKEPILSQSHVFMQPVPAKDRWRISKCSSVPTSLHNLMPNQLRLQDRAPSDIDISVSQRPVRVRCSFWVDRSPSGPKPVRWKSPVIRLDTFLEISCCRIHYSADDPWSKYSVRFFPDFTEEFFSSHEYQDPSFSDPIPKGERNYNFGKWLIQRYDPNPIWLALLGVSQTGNTGSALSLILCMRSEDNWERLGLCQWFVPGSEEVERDQFEGDSLDWMTRDGIFGYIE